MMNSRLKWIRGGRIITATEDFVGDVLIGDGQILAVGKNLDQVMSLRQLPGDRLETVDAEGFYVFPGAIDAHTHLDLEFMGTSSSDDFESGTLAAIKGGTTSLIDFAIQEPGRSLRDALSKWHEKARGKAAIDYAFHMGVTDYNPQTEKEIPWVIDQGITSFKCFMAYKGSLMVDDGQLFKLMLQVKKLGGIVTAHCENAEMISVLSQQYLSEGKTSPLYHELSHPALGEAEATHRFIALSRVAGTPAYVVHLTCEEALQQVKDSVTRHHHPIFAETCPQYLLLDRNLYENPGFEGAKWVMSPPLRTQRDQETLWNGLRDGLIQTVATDHCPFRFQGQKEMGKDKFTSIPNGAPGIENRMNLIFTYGVMKNRISLNRFVQVMSTNPAKIFGMYPKKGTIAPGSDADLVIFDPKKESTISVQSSYQRCDYSAFEGFKTTGEPVSVMIRGEWVMREGKITATPGTGRFIERSKVQPWVDRAL